MVQAAVSSCGLRMNQTLVAISVGIPGSPCFAIKNRNENRVVSLSYRRHFSQAAIAKKTKYYNR